MKDRQARADGAPLNGERGSSLIETLAAVALLLIVMAGLMSMDAVATTVTENYGHLGARTAEYAQDKMEQLLALAYPDSTSNTVVFPATTGGGSGLTIGGSSNTAAPNNLYVDWLASDGSYLGGGTTPPSNWFYERVWEITCASASYPTPQACNNSPATGIKQITVTVTVRTAVGGFLLAKSTVASLKSAQF
jgi:Tfp pilus assembly protein PilV